MYCAECGTANSVGAETCEVCGSPLGPSSGERSCHACGAPVDEHDRFCRACGQSQSGADAGRFEPGPSFVDDSSLEVDPSELPPWLRQMTLDKTEQENGHVAASASVVEQSETLPPWLDSKPSGTANGFKSPPSTPRTAAQEDESAESFSLISEDDLPEWLRALGDQEFESEETQPAPFAGRLAGRPATASPAATAIPSVSRAWLSRPRNAETEGAAEVAEDFAPLETGPTAGYARIAKPQTAELTSPDESQTPPAAEPQIVGEGSTASDTRRVRLIMLSVVVVLVVILGYYAVSNFL